jgi:Divergent InlB B-repeat domain
MRIRSLPFRLGIAAAAASALVALGAAHGETRTLRVVPHEGGAVRSAPARILCGTRCSAPFRRNAVVELRGLPGGSWAFSSWRGECVGTATVRPRFERRPGSVNVVVGGSGHVVGDSGGIRCGPGSRACAAELGLGTTLELTAQPAADSVLRKWGGACSAATGDRCRVLVAAQTAVTAAFGRAAPLPGDHPLVVENGVMRSDPPGIDCPLRCTASFAGGTLVSLDLTAGAALWTQACTGFGPACVTSVDAPTRVAAFHPPPAAPPPAITKVDVTVAGPGTVVGPRDLRCGARSTVCNVVLRSPPFVRLLARPRPGTRFGGWRGACRSQRRVCVVRVAPGRDVAAAAFFRP